MSSSNSAEGSEPTSDSHEDDCAASADTGSRADYLEVLTGGGSVHPDLLRAAAVNESEEDSESDGAVAVTFQLTRDLNKRLDKYLQDRVPFMSRTQLQRLIREEGVRVNGRQAKPSTSLRLGDAVEVLLPPPPSNEIPAQEMHLEVLAEDDHLIILNKQPDLIVHPARGNKTGTLINGLAWHFANRSSGSLSEVGKDQVRPGVVHRLDRHTSGVIAVAKSETAHYRLARQFEARRVDKRYLAIVHGIVEPVADIIDLPIGKHPRFRELMAVRHDESAKECRTVYRVRRQYDRFALVELELLTGRTHQIRVHLSHMGWPIVGDDLYGGEFVLHRDLVEGSTSEDRLIDRQALHATTLAFRDPITGQSRQHTAPLWSDMAHMIALLNEHAGQSGSWLAPAGSALDLDDLLAQPPAQLPRQKDDPTAPRAE